jgi:hypothetical protein
MRHSLLACLLPVVLLASANPAGDFKLTASGNDFLRVCEPRGGHPAAIDGLCSGYANGVIDGYDYAFGLIQAQRHEPVNGAFCPPDGINRAQQYRVAVKFMRDHPEETHRVASALIAEAMVAAFPCPQAKAPEKAPNK